MNIRNAHTHPHTHTNEQTILTASTCASNHHIDILVHAHTRSETIFHFFGVSADSVTSATSAASVEYIFQNQIIT